MKSIMIRTYTLIFGLLCLLTNLTYAQESAILANNTSEIEDDCGDRYSSENYIPLFNLVPGEEYLLRFSHNENFDKEFDFFDQKKIEDIWFQDEILHFIPTVEFLDFHHPGYDCDGDLIDRNTFILSPKNPNLKKNFPINPVSGDTPQFLVENVLLGDFCLNISNVTAPGAEVARGKFYDGEGSINIETGVMLASGNIQTGVGPNNANGAGSNVGGPSDPDLALFMGVPSLDASIIEFDFVPDQDSIQFDYVFASEEYCEYVGQPFNDAFGFFLSGPGINGPYSNNADNIALIPGTSDPVTINTVNFTINGEYYVSNAVPPGGGANCDPEPTGKFNDFIQYDGFTTVLQAKAEVVPCETYHIKLAVSDGSDGIFDSAIFLGQNSFISGTPGIKLTTEVGYTDPVAGAATEGCEGAFIAFKKWNFTLQEVVLSINIENTSTATEGVDYGDLPEFFTIASGVNNDTLWLDIFNDILAEGVETIDISIGGLCDCDDPIVQVIIQDPEPLEVEPIEDIGICNPETRLIPVNVSGGTPPYSYSWSNGDDQQATSIYLDQSGMYGVTITDDCGQEAEESFFVEIYPNYDEFQTVEICEGEFFMAGGAPQSTAGQYVDVLPTINNCDSTITTNLIIKPNAVYDTLIYTCANDPIIIGSTVLTLPGIFDVPLIDEASNGCDSIVTVEVEWLNPISSIGDPDTLTCDVDSVQLQTIVPNTGEGLEYIWEGPNGYESSDEAPYVYAPGIYTLTVTQSINGVFCESFFPFSNEVPIDTLAPELAPIGDLTISCGLTDVMINPEILNIEDLPMVDYSWTGPNGFTSTDASITVSDSGLYVLQVINPLTGCIDEVESYVAIDNIEPEVSALGGAIGCSADSIQISSSVNLINGEFTWQGPNGYTSSNQNPFIYESGEYIVEYRLTDDCIAYDTISIINDNTIPQLTAENDTVICNIGQGNLISSSTTNNVTFQWIGPNGFQEQGDNIIANDPGVYTVIATGENGCTNEESVQLIYIDYEPEFITLNDTIDCGEDFINLPLETTDTDLTFMWIGPNGFTSNDPNPSTNVAGSYSVTVTNDFGCEETESLEIASDTLIPQVSIEIPIIDCKNLSPIIDVFDIQEELDFDWTGPSGFTSTDEDPMITEEGLYDLTILSENGCENSYSFMIEIDTISPDFTAEGDTLDCLNGTATLNSSLSGGLYTALWLDENGNTVGQNFSENVGSEGIYTIIATNKENGCQSSRTAEIFRNDDVPDIQAAGDTINCLSSNFEISSSSSTAGVTYEWIGPNGFNSNMNNSSVSDPGNYTVTVTAPNGCIAIETVKVIEDNNTPSIALEGGKLTCDTEELNIETNATGGNNLYSWSGPNSFSSADQDPLINESGLYTVTVTSANGCTSEQSVNISEDFNIPTSNISTIGIIDCNNPSIDITLNTNAPAGSIFQWTLPNGQNNNNKDLTVSEGGTYSIEITGINGCVQTDEITIEEDLESINITPNDLILDCNNPASQLDIDYSSTLNVFNIDWEGPNNFNSVQLKPIVSDGGTYQVTITANNGCTSSATINVEDNKVYPEVGLLGEQLSCLNESVDILTTNESNEFNYEWADFNNMIIGGNSSLVSVSDEGKYYLKVTDSSNGCETLDSIIIEKLPELEDFTLAVENPNCNISTGTIIVDNVFGGTPPYEYSVDYGNNFQNSNEFSNLVGGDYTIVVRDNSGCILESDAFITSIENYELSTGNLFAIVLGESQQINVSTTIPNTDITSITWTPDVNLSCTDCLNPIATPTETTMYNVIVVDKNGCDLSTTIEIRVADNPIYVPNIFTPNNDGLNDIFSIYGDYKTIQNVEIFSIYDRWGESIFLSENINPLTNPEEIQWSGNFKDAPVKQGVYSYYIVYIDQKGQRKELIGDITIMR